MEHNFQRPEVFLFFCFFFLNFNSVASKIDWFFVQVKVQYSGPSRFSTSLDHLKSEKGPLYGNFSCTYTSPDLGTKGCKFWGEVPPNIVSPFRAWIVQAKRPCVMYQQKKRFQMGITRIVGFGMTTVAQLIYYPLGRIWLNKPRNSGTWPSSRGDTCPQIPKKLKNRCNAAFLFQKHKWNGPPNIPHIPNAHSI